MSHQKIGYCFNLKTFLFYLIIYSKNTTIFKIKIAAKFKYLNQDHFMYVSVIELASILLKYRRYIKAQINES